MKRVCLALFIGLILCGWSFAAPLTTDVNQKVYNVVLHLTAPADFGPLKDLALTVTARSGADYRLMASMEEIAHLRLLGYQLEVLGRNDRFSRAGYHTYASAVSELQGLQNTFPNLVQLQELGPSVQGKQLVALKISDNVTDSEAEPALLYDASIHGDEEIGTEVAFGFIHYLLNNYGEDAQVTQLVDENEIFVVPFVNADRLGVARGNANGVDMNRDYAMFWSGFGAWNPQPETVAIMNLVLRERFMYTISYHSGAEVINYTWDGVYTRSPEDDLEQAMSGVYAQQSGYDITNGADWYIADGTSEDWYAAAVGSLAVIVELSSNYMPPPAQIPNVVNRNVPSMIDWAAQSDRGVRGFVTDAASGLPVEALIFADGRLAVTSDPELGDYYRLLPPGNQNLSVWANGYGWTDLSVTVPTGTYVEKDLALAPAPGEPYAALICVFALRKDAGDNPPNVSLPPAALGGHDDAAFSTGVGGSAVFDFGANTPAVDGPGSELTVYEQGNDDGYMVLVAQQWGGPWKQIGAGTGTQSFDIGASGLSQARYVLIRDDGDGQNNNPTPGVDIDAIEVTPVCEAPLAEFTGAPLSGAAPLSVTFTSAIEVNPGCLTSVAWDFGDGGSSAEANPVHLYQEAGTYTVALTATGPGGEDQRVRENYITVTGGTDDDIFDDDTSVPDDDAADDDSTADDDSANDDDDNQKDSSGCGC